MKASDESGILKKEFPEETTAWTATAGKGRCKGRCTDERPHPTLDQRKPRKRKWSGAHTG